MEKHALGEARDFPRFHSPLALCNLHLVIIVSLLLCVPAEGRAQDAAEHPPVVGRPERFSGAVGSFQEGDVTLHAEPRELVEGQSLLVTVRVATSGDVQRPPHRPDLKSSPRFAARFYIEDLPNQDRLQPESRQWAFVYRFKPRDATVSEVPALEFNFYKPGFRPPSRGYQTIYAEALAISVKPPTPSVAPRIAEGIESQAVPASVLALTTGTTLLRTDEPRRLPRLLLIGFLLAAPPTLFVGWFFLWRRLRPDAARQSSQLRSWAGHRALYALRNQRSSDKTTDLLRAAQVVTEYLHQRFELSAKAPTPAEVGRLLRGSGLSSPGIEKAERFYSACDAARFAPVPSDGGAPIKADDVILALEAELCSRSAS